MSTVESLSSKLHRYLVPAWNLQSTEGADVYLRHVLLRLNRETSRRYLPHYVRVQAVLFALLAVAAVGLGPVLDSIFGVWAPILVDLAATLELMAVIGLGSLWAALQASTR